MNDPFLNVALVYVGYDCDQCLAYECAAPGNPDETARIAKEKGWHVVPKDNDWSILCPQCKES